MPTNYRTPGVYVQESSTLPPTVAAVATAIPAFIGVTETGTVKQPVRLTSMLDFVNAFGNAPQYAFNAEDGTITNSKCVLYDSMQLFFENGGSVCWAVSAAHYGDKTAAKDFNEAVDTLQKVDEVTMVLFPDAAVMFSATDLGLVQQHALEHCAKMRDRFAVLDVKCEKGAAEDALNFRNAVGNKNLMYGAAYYPYVKTGTAHEFGFESVVTKLGKTDLIESTKVFLPAEGKKGASAVLDEAGTALARQAKAKTVEGYDAALKALQDEVSFIPASGAVAGIIASTDLSKGVWQAPANVSISGITDVSVCLTDDDQDGLNVDDTAGKSVNAIRKFTGKGILVWGARTLDGNSSEWKYIPVRRLFIYVEESVMKSTMWAVFQPNDLNTWVKIKAQITSFLTGLWRDGALAGASADDAFFVNVGLGSTMTSDDILAGNLIVEVGLAAVRPAEFIVLRFSHKVQE